MLTCLKTTVHGKTAVYGDLGFKESLLKETVCFDVKKLIISIGPGRCVPKDFLGSIKT